MDTNQNIKQTIRAYVSGKLTETELRELISYMQSSSNEEDIKEIIYSIMNESTEEVDRDLIGLEETHFATLTAIRAKIQQENKIKPLYAWKKYVKIAAAVLVICSAGYWVYYLNKNDSSAYVQSAKIIKPGQQAATLTLSDGRQIYLNNVENGQIAKENGVEIIKQGDGQIVYNLYDQHDQKSGSNTLSTARGESYLMKLPDGTKVWLNAASSITYPSNIKTQKERKVKLHGEAYFEVAALENSTFIVETSKEKVQVLGTHFNVSDYSEDYSSHVTLIEGRVKVIDENRHDVILQPNQQVINNGVTLQVKDVDVNEVVAWKNGEFMFDKQTLDEIMKSLARWYDIDVEISNSLKNMRIWGSISRSDDLEKVLQIIQLTDRKIQIKIQGRRVILMK